MPLRDHFRPPLSEVWPWHTVHGNWATKMVDRLNGEMLDDRFMSQSGRHFGAQVEVDVGTPERVDRGSLFAGANGHAGGVATEPVVFAAPVPLSAVVGFDDPDLFEVKGYRGGGGWNLVAAVELVSESNKDRPESRRALAVKVGSYLQQGVSVVVDTVTNHAANPHAELADVLRLPPALRWESPTGLSVVAYRAVRLAPPTGPAAKLDVWPYPLAVGEQLPTVPLWLAPDLSVPLELERTNAAACHSLRIR